MTETKQQLVKVKGYHIPSDLALEWANKISPILYSAITAGWNPSVDPDLTLYTAADQQFVRLVATYLLGFVDPTIPYGTGLFDELSRLTPQRFCECVLLRENPVSGGLEVYLTQRSPDDTAYPGQFHCPGSAIRNGERFEDVAARVARDEFKRELKSAVVLREAEFYFQEERGWGCSTPVIVELDGEPDVGKWYPVNAFPEKTVRHHYPIIGTGITYWENRQLCDAFRHTLRALLGHEELDLHRLEEIQKGIARFVNV